MLLQQIDTLRSYQTWPSWQILYEQEDDFAQYFQLPPTHLSKFREIANKIVFKMRLAFLVKGIEATPLRFAVLMNPDFHRQYLNKKNLIAFIVDYWKKYDVKAFNTHFKDSAIVYLASLEAIAYLKEQGCTLNLQYLGFSIADKYLPLFNETITKDIDIIQIGRKNLLLEEWTLKLVEKYPNINYVHRKLINNRNIYFSTKFGEIGELKTRMDFLRCMQRAKISLVSSPGLDGGDWKTGGLNPVTPRVIESALTKCYMVGRFVHNEDYDYFGLQNLVYEVDNYEAFELKVLQLLAQETGTHTEQYQQFLYANCNSVRAAQVANDIKTWCQK